MPGRDIERTRNQTISFRATPEERAHLEARIKLSGMQKREYFMASLLHQPIKIAVGKYKSDRLGMEIRKLSERFETVKDSEETADLLRECKALMEEFIAMTGSNDENSL